MSESSFCRPGITTPDLRGWQRSNARRLTCKRLPGQRKEGGAPRRRTVAGATRNGSTRPRLARSSAG